MADENSENLGLEVAHTLAVSEKNQAVGGLGEVDAERAAKVGAGKAAVADAMGDLAAQLVGQQVEEEQPSLMLDEMDEQMALFSGPVRHVAKQIDISRRGRGRPKGSQNKASREFADVLQRMGYRHPGLNLAAMANADPAALAVELAGFECGEHQPLAMLRALKDAGKITADDVMKLMDSAMSIVLKANAELLPYFESKAPTKLNVDKKSAMGIMVIGEMEAPKADKSDYLDLTNVDAP